MTLYVSPKPRFKWVRFVCWFSKKYWDIHDYRVEWGGDDLPTHFYTYTCWNCGKEFQI